MPCSWAPEDRCPVWVLETDLLNLSYHGAECHYQKATDKFLLILLAEHLPNRKFRARVLPQVRRLRPGPNEYPCVKKRKQCPTRETTKHVMNKTPS